ncbi:MAG: lamin tail domain-containing protein [Pseudomonadota bacterium]
MKNIFTTPRRNYFTALTGVVLAFCLLLYPSETRCSDVVANGMHWITTSLDDGSCDSAGEFGSSRSLAFDANGTAGIAYNCVQGGESKLNYASASYGSGSVAFAIETVAIGSPGMECGKRASLVFDGGGPYIFFNCSSGTKNGLWYAYKNPGQGDGSCPGSAPGGDWLCEFVRLGGMLDYSIIGGIDVSGVMVGTVSPATGGVFYVARDGSNTCGADPEWSCKLVDATGTYATFTLVPNADMYTAFKRDDNLWFAKYVGGGGNCDNADWECSVIQNNVIVDSSSPLTMGVDIAGNVDILFLNSALQLSLAAQNGNGSPCNGPDAGSFNCDFMANVGSIQASLAMTNNGAYIAYPHSDVGGPELALSFPGTYVESSTDICPLSTSVDCGPVIDNPGTPQGQFVSIAYRNYDSTNKVGIVHRDDGVGQLLYAEARTIDVRINEVFYKPTSPNDEWVELYVRKGGNLNGLDISTQDADGAYLFPSTEVDSGDFLVLYMGTNSVCTTPGAPSYYCWGKTSEIMNNTGDNFRLRLDNECHDWMAYGVVTGGEINDPPPPCTWNGTYPACGAACTAVNPSSSNPANSISQLGQGETWLDGYDDDTVSNWEESGAASGPPTFGPYTRLSSNAVAGVKKSNGETCSSITECQSGYCVDSVCCNTACGGGNTNDCQACSIAQGASVNGTCANRANGASCNDSIYCNGVDTCQTGACSVHAGDPCPGPDGDTDCSESCNESSDNCTTNDPNGTSCPGGTCTSGACVLLTDGPPTDIGVDAGVDVGVDVGVDIGSNVGLDIGADTSADVGKDTGVDVGMDVGVDSIEKDAKVDAGADAVADKDGTVDSDNLSDAGINGDKGTGVTDGMSEDLGPDAAGGRGCARGACALGGTGVPLLEDLLPLLVVALLFGIHRRRRGRRSTN